MGATNFGALLPMGAMEEGGQFSAPGEVNFGKLLF